MEKAMKRPKSANRSISALVTEVIDNDLSLQDSLNRDYANISSIARLIQPQLENELNRSLNLDAIITAIKRSKTSYSINSPEILSIISNSAISLRTDVSKIVVAKSKTAISRITKIIDLSKEDSFIHISGGSSVITIILDSKVANKIITMFNSDEIIGSKEDLAVIMVQSPEEIIYTPGCAISFYNQVSRRHVNIEDTSSCHTDTIIVVNMNEVSNAFTALSDLISISKNRLSTLELHEKL